MKNENKNNTLKINTKKRNIIIASVIGVIAITAGTFFGVKAYKEANKVEDPTPQVVATSTDIEKETVETDSSNVTKDETTVAKETKTPATEKPTSEPTTSEPTTDKPAKPTATEKPANPTPKPANPTPKPEPTTEAPTHTHTHSYTSKVTTQPTCCKEGVRTYTCSCGDTYTEAIATVAHTWVTTHFDERPIIEYHYLADDGFDFTVAGYTEQQTIDYCYEHDCGAADQPVVIGHREGYDETKCSVCGKIK